MCVGRAAEGGSECGAGAAGGAVARAAGAAQRLEHEARRAGQVQPALRLAAAQQRTHRREQGTTSHLHARHHHHISATKPHPMNSTSAHYILF